MSLIKIKKIYKKIFCYIWLILIKFVGTRFLCEQDFEKPAVLYYV